MDYKIVLSILSIHDLFLLKKFIILVVLLNNLFYPNKFHIFERLIILKGGHILSLFYL
jgi:hypothetical protein